MEKEDFIKKYGVKSSVLILEAVEEMREIGLIKYLGGTRILKRIYNNLDSIEIIPHQKNYWASYGKDTKIIELDESLVLSPDKLKSNFFHELIHCISTQKNVNNDNIDYIGFEVKDNNTRKSKYAGLNEAAVVYWTYKRNEFVGRRYLNNEKNNRGNIWVANQFDNLVKLGLENALGDCFFNNPQDIENVFIKNDIDLNILNCIDIMYENESTYYEISKTQNVSGYLAFLAKLKGNEYDITDIYMQNIKKVKEQEEFLKKLKRENIFDSQLLNKYLLEYNKENKDGPEL